VIVKRSAVKRHKVGLFHHCGGGNLGDDATVQAMIQNIKGRWPDATICGFSMNPEDTQARHGIRSYPLRRTRWILGGGSANAGDPSPKRRVKAVAQQYPALLAILRTIYFLAVRFPAACFGEVCLLVKSFSVLRSFDLLVISGGGQLTGGWGGPWKFPYTIFKFVCLARLAGVKPVFLNVGAGPLAGTLTKFFIRTALSLADAVSFRDAKTAELVRQIGFRGDSPVFPDPVFSLQIDSAFLCRPADHRLPNVGIGPMPYGLEPLYADGNPAAYDSLIRPLAAFGARFLADKGRITLFCTDIGVDPPSVQDLERALKDASCMPMDDLVEVATLRTVTDLLRTMSGMDYVITCRFHAVVFAHLLNIPVIALSYHPKITTLMKDLGLSRYCLDIRAVDAETLRDAFADLVVNATQIKSRMRTICSSYRETLAGQFDHLFAQSAAR
jgi:polysaccharide pyruvyl transferase WcaK-like protein